MRREIGPVARLYMHAAEFRACSRTGTQAMPRMASLTLVQQHYMGDMGQGRVTSSA